MGWFRDTWYQLRYKLEDSFDWVKDRLGLSSYSSSVLENQIDVDKVLAEFRDKIQSDVSELEDHCMNEVSSLFRNLKDKTRSKFPDLLNIIDLEQKQAKKALKGTVLQYVKEHLSKNDERFLEVLKMQPGKAKSEALKMEEERVLEDANREFNQKLKIYAENILKEFNRRFDIRISNQDKQLEKSIKEMQKLEEESLRGKIDIDKLKDSCVPIMESGQCIISVLEMSLQ